MTITEFLIARLDEEEQAANELPERPFDWYHSRGLTRLQIVRIERDRILALTVALRAIVELHKSSGPRIFGETCGACGTGYEGEYAGQGDFSATDWPCPTLRNLAAAWADHPAYLEEWKP